MLNARRLAASGIIATAVVTLAACSSGGATAAPSASSSTSATTPSNGASALNTRILHDEQVTVDTSKYKANPPYTVGVIPQGPFNGWGEMFNLTVQDTLQKSGKVGKILLTNPAGNPDTEISQMQTMIVQHPNVIILTPLSKAGLSAPVQRAMAAGIPVVLCGSGVTTNDYVTQGGRNLYQVAYDSATKLAQMMGGKGNVMMLNGIAGTDTAITWHAAALQAFSKYPGIKVVADQYSNWSISLAKQKATAILAANPKIDGVWTGGSENAIGAIEAFAAAGRPMPVFGTTNPLNGFLRLAKQYNIKFVADPYPPEMAQVCANLALDVLQGKPVKKYVDMASLGIKGVGEYTNADIAANLKPQYNDDFIAPAVIPASKLTTFLAK